MEVGLDHPRAQPLHCLGVCQVGGSVIDWVMKAEGVSFRHAVELLRERYAPSLVTRLLWITGTGRGRGVSQRSYERWPRENQTRAPEGTMSASYVIKVITPFHLPQIRTFSQPSVTVGREMSDVVLKDPNSSRNHALLQFDGESVEVADMGSMNGTFIGEHKVARARWLPGEPLRIANCLLELQRVCPQAPAGGTAPVPSVAPLRVLSRPPGVKNPLVPPPSPPPEYEDELRLPLRSAVPSLAAAAIVLLGVLSVGAFAPGLGREERASSTDESVVPIQLERAEESARSAALRAEAIAGFVPTAAQHAYQLAESDRFGGDSRKMSALLHYWNSSFWSELAVSHASSVNEDFTQSSSSRRNPER